MASAQEVLKRGYLTKSPPQRQALAKWKRRWCMLCDSRLVYPCAKPYVRLEYYEDETAALACKEPKGAVDLLADQVKIETNSSSSSRAHKHVFDIITTGRVYHMSADSAPEKHEWVEALRGVVNQDEEAASYRAHIMNTRQSSVPSLIYPQSNQPTKAEGTQLRRPENQPVTNRRQRPVSLERQEQPTISDHLYSAPAAVVPRASAQSSIAERIRSMSGSTAGRWRKEQVRKVVSSNPKPSDDYDVVAPRPPDDYDEVAPRRPDDYAIPENHKDDSDEEDTQGPVSIKQTSSSPRKSVGAMDADSDSEEDTAGPTSIVSRSSDDRLGETISRKVLLDENPFMKKRFSHGYDNSASDAKDYQNMGPGDSSNYQNVDYSRKMKGAVDSEANSESYEALPSHSHLAKQTGGKAMYPPAGRTGRQGKVTGSFDSDYAMAAPHHDFGHSPSHAPPSRPPRKNNYDYVQPGARPSDSLPIKQVQPEGPPTSSRSRRPDNYDYVQPKPRLASSPFHQADGEMNCSMDMFWIVSLQETISLQLHANLMFLKWMVTIMLFHLELQLRRNIRKLTAIMILLELDTE
eukprot:m.58808 g.58808  ORF g.58808 m.58808 type:complete len:576 (+) comp34833_c0_seq1:109-1836(+)